MTESADAENLLVKKRCVSNGMRHFECDCCYEEIRDLAFVSMRRTCANRNRLRRFSVFHGRNAGRKVLGDSSQSGGADRSSH